MTIHRILFTSIVLACATPAQAQDTRNPVPSAEAQQKALALVRDVYKDEYDKAKTSAEKEELAGELLESAAATKKPADRYALLRVARDLSVEAVGPTAFEAVDEMGKTFRIDALEMKAKVLAHCARLAKTPAQNKLVAETAIALIKEAVGRSEFAMATHLGKLGLAAARKARDTSLPKQIASLIKEVQETAEAHAEMTAAMKILDANPTDPDANLAVGKYRCFTQGNWDKGVPMLALGSDAALKETAVKELRGETAPKDQAALGDAWWALGEKQKGETTRERLLGRAEYWYKKAAPGLSGFSKVKVAKRLERRQASAKKEVKGHEPRKPRQDVVRSLVVEVLIDGDSEFIVTPQGICWRSKGVAKPGRHGGKNLPTLINGKPWMPVWGKPAEERGRDMTQVLPLKIDTAKLQLQLLAIGPKPGGNTMEKRDPVTLQRVGKNLIVTIPDHQGGSRWYRFALREP